MKTHNLDSRLFEELRASIDRGLSSGDLLTDEQVKQQTSGFRDRFGPEVLRAADGEVLLMLMHGRRNVTSKCLAYWLEFKDDEEFAGNRFGGIGGGSAMKYGVYQRQTDGEWMTGDSSSPHVISVSDAIQIARRQRAELVAGSEALAALDASDPSDPVYATLQSAMEQAAPELCRAGWAHKYWFLIHPDKLDDYHSPRYQRFHLFKLLQVPPDKIGIRDASAPRFVCAGRFVAAARSLGVPINTLGRVLNQRHGAFHRYWRIGTTDGGTGESHWAEMREGEFVSIGWSELPSLSPAIGKDDAKAQIRDWLLPYYSDKPGLLSRKAGEILNFAQTVAENDIALACDGETVLGVGRVRGSYEHDPGKAFPHKRSVEWLLLEPWRTPEPEGLRTTVFELGRSASNLLELEQRLFHGSGSVASVPRAHARSAEPPVSILPPLDAFTARVEAILRRKGQVIFYGPPGTGKTFRALQVAKELASRSAFRKRFSSLTRAEADTISGTNGSVRMCTFHPGYGYEDFVEGFRPRVAGSAVMFAPENGLFKQLCEAAKRQTERHFFLVIDEINRGDLPRIFGELLTVIEWDKRQSPVTLPITREEFTVPENLFLIGTMNTADRSISLMDAALRRRFGFVELMPDSRVLGGIQIGGLSLGPWLDALNERIRKFVKRDARNLQVGHAYLMPAQPITSVAEFARVLRDDIIPLLEEYCYDDFDALTEILGTKLVDAKAANVREELFSPTREQDLIEACTFVEMEQFVVERDAAVGAPASEDVEPSAEDAEVAGHVESAV